MSSPELQSLAMEAKKAAALVKYMPLPAQQLPAVAATLTRALKLEPWMARGSALANTQVRLHGGRKSVPAKGWEHSQPLCTSPASFKVCWVTKTGRLVVMP